MPCLCRLLNLSLVNVAVGLSLRKLPETSSLSNTCTYGAILVIYQTHCRYEPTFVTHMHCKHGAILGTYNNARMMLSMHWASQ